MAYVMELTREKTYELLELTVRNGARPVVVLEDPDGIAHEIYVELLFSDRDDTVIFDYSDFMMEYVFSVEKMRELSDKAYVVVEDVRYLYGKSATSKILADFVRKMNEAQTGVLFIGRRAKLDMAEFTELADEFIQYIISIDSEM